MTLSIQTFSLKFFSFFLLLFILDLTFELINKVAKISSKINLLKNLPSFFIFCGLCNSNTDSFQEILSKILQIFFSCHSFKSGTFFNTSVIILLYFFSVNPSVRLYFECIFFTAFLSLDI